MPGPAATGVFPYGEPGTGGEVLINGQKVTGPGPDRAFVFQDFAILPWASVISNVAFGMELRGVAKSEREAIVILNARAGVKQINSSLVEMARSFGATPMDAFLKIYLWAALPEILSGIRIGFIRAVKGVIIGQLLVSIVGFGALFELYS